MAAVSSVTPPPFAGGIRGIALDAGNTLLWIDHARLAGILFGALRAGGVVMQARTGTPIDIVLVVQSLIVLFVAAPPLVRSIFRIKRPGAIDTLQVSKGWGA